MYIYHAQCYHTEQKSQQTLPTSRRYDPTIYRKCKTSKGVDNVDIVFCSPSFCVPDPKKPKNIIFSPWGHENIYNGVA